MTHTITERNWRSSAWVVAVGLGLLMSACGTSQVRNDCAQGPQMLDTTAPMINSCDQAPTPHDPFGEMEFRHGSPNG